MSATTVTIEDVNANGGTLPCVAYGGYDILYLGVYDLTGHLTHLCGECVTKEFNKGNESLYDEFRVWGALINVSTECNECSCKMGIDEEEF